MSFETPDGRHVPAVTADEMREVDRVAVEEVGVELLMMMENAGRTLATFARDLYGDGVGSPDDAPAPVVVLAGAGGNGGGGLCAARHLLNHGVPVEVVLDRPPADLSGAAATQWHVLDAMGVEPADERAVAGAFAVDALVGYGLSEAPRGRAADLIEACDSAARALALDVPSGVDATTGDRPGVAVDADHTLTLALPKTGLAAAGVGDLSLADIAIPATVYERVGIDYESPFDGAYRTELTTPSA